MCKCNFGCSLIPHLTVDARKPVIVSGLTRHSTPLTTSWWTLLLRLDSASLMEMFFERVSMGVHRPTQGDQTAYSATALPGSAALTFVISTGAYRISYFALLATTTCAVFLKKTA